MLYRRKLIKNEPISVLHTDNTAPSCDATRTTAGPQSVSVSRSAEYLGYVSRIEQNTNMSDDDSVTQKGHRSKCPLEDLIATLTASESMKRKETQIWRWRLRCPYWSCDWHSRCFAPEYDEDNERLQSEGRQPVAVSREDINSLEKRLLEQDHATKWAVERGMKVSRMKARFEAEFGSLATRSSSVY